MNPKTPPGFQNIEIHFIILGETGVRVWKASGEKTLPLSYETWRLHPRRDYTIHAAFHCNPVILISCYVQQLLFKCQVREPQCGCWEELLCMLLKSC